MGAKIINKIERLFFEKLEKNTAWCKEEVKKLYKECVIIVLLEDLDDKS